MNDSAQPPTEPVQAMRSQRVVFFTLIAMLLVVLALVLLVFWHFLIIIGLASAMALLLKSAHARLTQWLRGRDSVSALLIVLAVTIVILVPVLGALATIASQALSFYAWIRPRLTNMELEASWQHYVVGQFPWTADLQTLGQGRIAEFLSGALSHLASAANNLLQGAVGGLTAAALEIALLLIMLYFFLRDGNRFRAKIREVSPLSRVQADEVLDQVARTMKASIASLLLVPLVQGVLATAGYWVMGVPNALLWGGLTTLMAFVPLVGTPLVWIPICIYLWVTGQVWQAVVLAVYSGTIVSMVDNVLRPWILKGSTHIHPLWSFLAILGGVLSFGPLGLLVGPLILSLGVSALRIFESDVLRATRAAVPPESGPLPPTATVENHPPRAE